METWKCRKCGYLYDPRVGDAGGGIAAGTPFEKLPDTWKCPRCRVPKSRFEKK
ncbi:MAG: rubredoxin [Methanomicrobiaceae archaeon]|uniref:Rubredoxin n=1 Tax=hydrocarbon metagenome TaxID=938273 RepID=A0A0W8FE18_9ZZZZ|nr:rubredoxin [Methanomicrobiaceae archaeon]MDD5419768.1 rubredoxin [Methanomicrobiaceae archaeon]